MIKNPTAQYVYGYHWMRLIRFSMKILAASDTESDHSLYTLHLGVVTPSVQVRPASACITDIHMQLQ